MGEQQTPCAWAWQEPINLVMTQTIFHVVLPVWERSLRKARKSPLYIHATKTARPGSLTRSESHRRYKWQHGKGAGVGRKEEEDEIKSRMSREQVSNSCSLSSGPTELRGAGRGGRQERVWFSESSLRALLPPSRVGQNANETDESP